MSSSYFSITFPDVEDETQLEKRFPTLFSIRTFKGSFVKMEQRPEELAGIREEGRTPSNQTSVSFIM